MKVEINIEDRKPIWIALSDFYIDTELQDYNFKHIASIINESSYSFEEIKKIDKEEIFPVLYSNLLSVAGVWTGFQEEWLIAEATKKLNTNTSLARIINSINYARFKWMYKDYWEKLEIALKQ